MSYILLISSVLIGAIFVLFIKPNNRFIRLLVAFSGAYLLSVTILHLFPDVYSETTNHKLVGILVIAGILLQSVLESFSKGIEHGHVHLHSEDKKMPWMLFTSLCIHAFSEGLPIHSADDNLLWAVVVHKIPIAIVLTSFLVHAKYSKRSTLLFLLIFALMSPLGIFISSNVSFLRDNHAFINAFIIGVFLHISSIILFESTENHKFNLKKFIAILSGILLTIFTL